MNNKQKAKRIRTFEQALGIQIKEHTRVLPRTVYEALAEAARKLGLRLEDYDVEVREQPDNW